MPVEYDLVVIGDSFEGIYAATMAAYLDARVALVISEQPRTTGSAETIYLRTLSHIASRFQQREEEAVLWDFPQPKMGKEIWTKAAILAEEVIATLNAENSLETLAVLGVDILIGKGEFCRLPQQAFVVGHRRLRSRAYLLATGSVPFIPPLEGLSKLGYLVPTDLWQTQNGDRAFQRIAILGDNPIAVELAQSLGYLGKEVFLLLQGDRILPAEDIEAAFLLQCQLEAEGIGIFSQASATQVRKIDAQKWIQGGNKAIEADEILVALGEVPDVEGLNLEGVGVKLRSRRIVTNSKLQTTNPQIYACGSLLGGYGLTHIARYEAEIAVKNALFLPRQTVDYRCIPLAIFTSPNLARVGMNEARARQQYGEAAVVVQSYYKSLPKALISGETTGFCKLVLHADGEILGAHFVGAQAAESIATVALAMQHRLDIKAMLHHFSVSPTFSEILQQVAIAQQRHRLASPSFFKALRKSGLRAMRNWSS
ncbi:MAG: NAD(P)/FAD-dependent oxidoreductase [Cyanobacteriota bacterium]|nr:NAD(P)/FAD-dependent oxidoreductase [Cyanobacteriota bacterium]